MPPSLLSYNPGVRKAPGDTGSETLPLSLGTLGGLISSSGSQGRLCYPEKYFLQLILVHQYHQWGAMAQNISKNCPFITNTWL